VYNSRAMLGTPARSGGVVLVVDDDPTLRFLLREALVGHGATEVLVAEDGRAAQELLRSKHVDVVITDLVMPELDGLDLIRWAREELPGPVWIINSGYDSFEFAAEAVNLGVFAFLPKPKDSFDDLRHAVRQALKHSLLKQERAQLHSALEESNGRLQEQVLQLQSLCALLQRQADIIDQDLQRAEAIQRALLPRRAPNVEGLQIAALHRPSQHVGGDLYGLHRLGPGLLGFYIADAAGHGVAAAMLSVLFQQRLKPLDAARRPRLPSNVIKSVNGFIRNDCAGRALFVTAVYGVLDVKSGEVVLASAGHPPVLVRRSDGTTERLERTGPALGLEEDPHFGETRLTLGEDDALLLFTDGVFGSVPTVDALARAVSESKHRGVDLLRSLHRPSPEDDVTLLWLHRGSGESVLDNGQNEPGFTMRLVTDPRDSELLRGRIDGVEVLSVRGRVTWTRSVPFYEACRAAIESGRPLCVDLEHCTYLDSTWLGTLHQVVALATSTHVVVGFHRASAAIVAQLEELHMSTVLLRLTDEAPVLPLDLEPIHAYSVRSARARVLAAHEALASIDDHNRMQFEDVVEAMRDDPSEPD
jgi:serine phosphatase RsbU (regulator of sigma subunit)/anti-anti-sigma regulatory factor